MSIRIKAFSSYEAECLAQLSTDTFIESHGHTAGEEDIQSYVGLNFNAKKLSEDLQDSRIFFNKIYLKDQIAGYSKLIINEPHPLTQITPVAKFERLYLLRDFYGLGLGEKLLRHNIEIAETHKQKGLWLFVWTGNKNGLQFYGKSNFKSIGQHDFKISATHSNPNYVMLKTL